MKRILLLIFCLAIIPTGSATLYYLTGNSSGSTGANGTFTVADEASTWGFRGSLISAGRTALPANALALLSITDDKNGINAKSGTATTGEFIYINVTIPNVASVNWFNMGCQAFGTTDTLGCVAWNYSNNTFDVFATATTAAPYRNLSANWSSAAQKAQFVSLTNGVLEMSIGAYGAGGSAGTVTASQFNVSIDVTLITAPTIVSSFPDTDFTNNSGAVASFNVTFDKSVTTQWFMNSTLLQTNSSVQWARYTNSSAPTGHWNVTAYGSNGVGAAIRRWNWTVNAAVSNYVPPPQKVWLIEE